MRRIALLIAVVAFGFGLFLALRSNPDLLSNVHWMPVVVLALVVTPAIQMLNAIEFYLTARLLGYRLGLLQCAEVTIIGSATNLLPLPGAAVVRVAALKKAGASVGRGMSVTALTAGMSIGVAFTYGGLWASSYGLFALLLAAAGALMLAAAALASRRLFGAGGLLALCTTRLGLVIADALRFLIAFAALGLPISFGQASILAVSTTLASLAGIVPAGIGVREWIAALVAPLIALQMSAAFVAAALSQIVGLPVLMLAAGLLSLKTTVANSAPS